MYITDVQIKGYECPFVTDLISVLWLPLHAPTPQSSRNSKVCSQEAGQVCRVGTVESGVCKAGGGPDSHCSVGFRGTQTGERAHST